MIKTKISILLLLLMLVNMTAFTVTAADDITGTEYEQEARILAALNIMGGYQDTSFRPDSLISRAEYANIIARIILDSDEQGQVQDTYFVDVPADYWAADSIYLLADMGLIKKNTRFKPEEAQTYYDAVRILINYLGYGEYAEENGGYPRGYLNVANSLGMLDGVAATTDNEGITRGNVARLIYNSLDVNFYHSEFLDVEETILSRRNIITGRGTVCATQEAALSGYRKVGWKEVLIVDNDGMEYLLESEYIDIPSMLGKSGKFYIDEDTDVLIYFGASGSSEEIYISAEKIEDVSSDYITYSIGDRTKKVTFSDTITVIVNGETIEAENPQDYMWPEVGGVRLTRSNGSSKYDIAYVDSYEAYIAEGVIADDNKIIFKPGIYQTGYIITDDYDNVKITKDGKEAKITDIKEWDVIHIARNAGNYTSVSIDVTSKNTVAGTITETYENSIVINGEEYLIDWRVFEEGLYPALELSTSAIFYYNMNGKIIAWSIDDAVSGTYGYLKNLRISEDTSEAYSTIYTFDGEFQSYQYEDRVSVNGTKYDVDELKYIGVLYDGKFIDQLVKYTIGSSGKITKIETAQNLEDSKNKIYGYDDSAFTLVLKNNFSTSEFIMIDHFNNGKFNDTYLANNETKVMMVPENMDEENFAIMTVKEAFTNNSKYRDNKPLDIGEVMLYNADRYLNVPMIVCKTSKVNLNSESIDVNSDVMLVDKCVVSVNNDNEMVRTLSGLYKGQRVTYEMKNDVDVADDSIHRGIGIQIKLDKNNIITGLRIVFDLNEDEFYVKSSDNVVGKNETAGWNSNLLVYYGNVFEKAADGSQIMINTGYDWDHYRGFLSNGMKVYKYNRVTQTAEVASVDELICSRFNPQEVVFRAYRSLVKELVILED